MDATGKGVIVIVALPQNKLQQNTKRRLNSCTSGGVCEKEEFHCIQRCPHFRGFIVYTEVSLFQDVGIEGFHCIHRCLFQWLGIEEVYRGSVFISECWSKEVLYL